MLGSLLSYAYICQENEAQTPCNSHHKCHQCCERKGTKCVLPCTKYMWHMYVEVPTMLRLYVEVPMILRCGRWRYLDHVVVS